MPLPVEQITPRTPPRKRRWFRRVVVLAIILLVFGGTFFATRGYILRRVTLGELAALTGGRVDAGPITLTTGGTLTIRDCVVRAPGVPGDGGLIFRAAKVEADVSWSSVLRGSPRITRVVLDEPLFRLSQATDDATVNVASLDPAGAGSAPAAFPLVLVRGGVVELGEHDREAYRVLRRIPVAGQVAHAADQAGDMRIAFSEVDERGEPVAGPGGLQLTGVVSKDAVTLNLGVISLASWPAESMPGPIREHFRTLDLQGEVRDATLVYPFEGQVSARVQLRDVAVTLPVEVKPSEDAEGSQVPIDPRDVGRRLRMRGVSGTVGLTSTGLEADLAGQVEGLAYKVVLRSQGSTPEAPFTCTITCDDLHLARKPEVLKFAPGIVRRRLEQFSDPTGRLDARVTISRPAAGAALGVEGTITLRGVSAAFERFPYPFRNLSGQVDFDDDKVVIKRIEGDAPGGVKVVATGLITPVTDDAKVTVDVTATNIPIDQTLRDAMSTRGRLIADLFSVRRHDQLVAAGLISSAGRGAGPAFDLGGIIDVHALVTRDPGPGTDNWHDVVTISLREARLIPDRVPYPIIARDVKIIKRDHDATVEGGTFRGPLGGTATVTARADLSRLTDPDAPFVPTIDIRATGVPLNRLLTHAVPDAAMLGDRPLREALGEVDFGGVVEVGASIAPGGDESAFRVTITGAGLTASPKGAAPRAVLSDAAVTLDVSHTAAGMTVRGAIGPEGSPPSACEFSVDSDRTAPGARLAVLAAAPGLNAATRVEDFVALAAPGAAAEIAALRAAYAPEGDLGMKATVEREAGGVLTTRVEVDRLRELTFAMRDGRVTFTESRGLVTALRRGDEPAVIMFRDFEAPAVYAAQPTGVLTLAGEIGASGGPAGTPLLVGLRGGRFESPLVRSIVGSAAPARLAGFFRDADLRGAFDFTAEMTPRDGPAGRAWAAKGSVHPRSLVVRFSTGEAAFPEVTGSIDFGPGEGRLRGLRLAAPAWTLHADGSWLTTPDGNVALTTTVDVEAASLTPDLRAVLPEGVRRAFDDLAGRVAGPIEVDGMSLSLAYDAAGELRALRVSGRAAVAEASLDAGVLIEHAHGMIEFTALREATDPALSFEVFAMLDHLNASGLRVTGARVRLAGLTDGSVLMPHFSAACHGGRLAADAAVRPAGADGRRTFEADIRLSGARFASILADFGTPGEGAEESDPDESRGLLDASLALGGVVGEPASRRGRGFGSVSGGRVLNFPLLVPLVRLTNLQLPVNETVDYAAGEFFVQGPRLNFEALSVYSPSVEVVGYGTVAWPGLDLDMRFRPRARSRIPMLTEVLEGIRNELVAVRAGGTLAKPELNIGTLPGTGRVLGRLFGQEPDEQERRLDAIEGRMREGTMRREGPTPATPHR